MIKYVYVLNQEELQVLFVALLIIFLIVGIFYLFKKFIDKL